MKQQNNLLTVKSIRILLLSFFFALMPSAISAQCPDEHHPHLIDLGLPSGTKWACCNVGATKPEEYGNHFAWGETAPKSSYTYDNYLHRNEEGNFNDIGTDIAGTKYDAATANWGKSWVMPNVDQMKELIENCTSEWTTENGVTGRRFTGPNGASIFLPAAGFRSGEELKDSVTKVLYWTSTTRPSSTPYRLNSGSSSVRTTNGLPYSGNAVRPVACIVIDATNFPDEKFRNWLLSLDFGKDSVLIAAEIPSIDGLNVDSEYASDSIADLTGIQYFTALTEFWCGHNQLTSLDVSKNTKLTLLSCEGNQLTSLDVSKNTELTLLACGGNPLKTIDVSKNTSLSRFDCSNNQLTSLDLSNNKALTDLSCNYNQLTTLDLSNNPLLNKVEFFNNQLSSIDVSKNTALTRLDCTNNQLTSLDLSNNTLLKYVWCFNNRLTSLDVSNDTVLKELHCYNNQLATLDLSTNTELLLLNCRNNQLSSIDVSKNTALTSLDCSYNQLTSLDFSQNRVLRLLYCHNNKIKGAAMDSLIASLPTIQDEYKGYFVAINIDDENEENVVTKAQVAAAKEKGWTTYSRARDIIYFGDFKEYEGSDPQTLDPIENGENINIGNEINSDTNLNGNVVGNILYNISSGNGEFNPEEGCIVVNKPMTDEAVSNLEGKDVFGEDFKDQYTGIVFKVSEGKGSVALVAETTGNMMLKVKFGSGDPVEMKLNGKLEISFPYNLTEETLVYIYGSTKAAQAKRNMKGVTNTDTDSGTLKIYNINVTKTSGIQEILLDDKPQDVYSVSGQKVRSGAKDLKGLPAGVYIVGGKKVIVK